VWWLLLALLLQGSLLPQPLRTHAARSNTFIFHHGHKVGHVGAQTPGAPRRYSPLTQTDVDRAAFIIRWVFPPLCLLLRYSVWVAPKQVRGDYNGVAGSRGADCGGGVGLALACAALLAVSW
jgi:hypothetical protein